MSLSLPVLWRQKMAADENIGSVWTGDETIMFLKLKHETSINAIFPSCFSLFKFRLVL